MRLFCDAMLHNTAPGITLESGLYHYAYGQRSPYMKKIFSSPLQYVRQPFVRSFFLSPQQVCHLNGLYRPARRWNLIQDILAGVVFLLSLKALLLFFETGVHQAGSLILLTLTLSYFFYKLSPKARAYHRALPLLHRTVDSWQRSQADTDDWTLPKRKIIGRIYVVQALVTALVCSLAIGQVIFVLSPGNAIQTEYVIVPLLLALALGYQSVRHILGRYREFRERSSTDNRFLFLLPYRFYFLYELPVLLLMDDFTPFEKKKIEWLYCQRASDPSALFQAIYPELWDLRYSPDDDQALFSSPPLVEDLVTM